MLQKTDFSFYIKKFLVTFIYPIAAAAIIISVLPNWEPREHWNVLLSYALLTLFCAFAPVHIFNARLTLGGAVMFSGIIMFDTWAGVWAAFLECLIIAFLYKPQFSKTMANAGQLIGTCWITGLAKSYLDMSGLPVFIEDSILIFVFWFTNTILCSIGIAYFFRMRTIQSMKSMITSGTMSYLLFMFFSSIGTRVVDAFDIQALLPIIVIFLVIRQIFHQYFDNLISLEQKVEKINHLNHSFLTALAASIDARDAYTSGHSQRVAHWGREIAIAIGLPKQEVDQIYYGGIIHDIGKIGIEDKILNKEGRLSSEEFAKIKEHTTIGYEIIKQSGVFEDLLPAVRSHHERLDGSGYPDQLTGDNIPLIAKILAISDSFDAMVSDRPYRSGMPVEEALKRLRDGAGSQYDPYLTEVFIKIIESYTAEDLNRFTKQVRNDKLAVTVQ